MPVDDTMSPPSASDPTADETETQLERATLDPRHSTTQPDDEILVRRAATEPEAFGELARRHAPRIRALLLRLTRGDAVLADDLVQETLFRAYRGLAGFEGRARFSTWLHRIAYFAYLNHRNRVPRHHGLPEGFDSTVTAPEGDLSPGRIDLRRDIALALRDLPEPYRRVVVMHFLRHVPYRDIAEQLGLPLGTVKTQLHRAKLRMRDKMVGWSETSPMGSSRQAA